MADSAAFDVSAENLWLLGRLARLLGKDDSRLMKLRQCCVDQEQGLFALLSACGEHFYDVRRRHYDQTCFSEFSRADLAALALLTHLCSTEVISSEEWDDERLLLDTAKRGREFLVSRGKHACLGHTRVQSV